MDAVRLFALLIYTFGLFAYGAMLALWASAFGRVAWGGRGRTDGGPGRQVDVLNGVLLFVSFLWFLANVATLLTGLTPVRPIWQLDVLTIVLAFSFPPVIMHMSWAEAVAADRSLSAIWRTPLWPAYALSFAIPAWSLSTLYAAPDGRSGEIARQLLGYGLSVAFIVAAVYCIALLKRKAVVGGSRERQSRRSLVFLFGCMIAVFVSLLVVTMVSRGSARSFSFAALVEVAAKSLPLVFMFVGTYYENRFQFFDLFVKRGVGFVVAIVVLTIWLAIMLPVLQPLATMWAAPWIFAIALVPAVVVIPWLYVAIGTVLDRRWLGRRFTGVGALTHFIGGLRSATTEAQLLERAQTGLAQIFGAPATVVVGDSIEPSPSIVQDVPVRSGDRVVGHFLMGARTGEAPYFSQDIELLASLADVFAHVLENLHLQERKLEQEQRTRELSLLASRSELKALRAQINPHFLFNALNSIAGLIHREPGVADRTIEQLADVFRYALRGAESEWAVLDDEIDFVRAYLEVERARFGDRLHTDVRIDDRARGARVPTMMLQTLVENAVKHGVASVRGPATVAVSAREEAGRLVMSVADNGPGFQDAGASIPARARGGYGLVNIRQRLEGYFGDKGSLSVARANGLTVVSVTLPLLHDEPKPLHPQELVR